jgi:hypothetical protein
MAKDSRPEAEYRHRLTRPRTAWPAFGVSADNGPERQENAGRQ